MVTTQSVARNPPVERLIPELLNKFEQIDYPDAQTRWAGRYKIRISGGKYEYKPQSRFIHNFGRSTGALLTYESGKVTMVTGFSWNQIAIAGMGVDRVTIQDASLGTTAQYWEMLINDGDVAELQTISFDPPLLFPNGVTVDNGWNAATGGSVEACIWGFTE